MSLHNWATFIIGFVSARIFYLVYQTGVEYLCIAQDLLRGDDSKNTFLK